MDERGPANLAQYPRLNGKTTPHLPSDAKPKLLILYHQREANEERLRIIRARYLGSVVVASDL